MAWYDDCAPVPKKGVQYTAVFPIYKTDGTLISSAASLDSEIYKDGGTVADCTNEATEIGQGIYYLTLTATEMNADSVVVIVKTSSTDAIIPVIALAPEAAGDIRVNLTQINSDSALIAKFAAAVGGNKVGTVVGTPSTTEVQSSDITDAQADLYNGRFLLFLTGALAGKATKVSDYAKSGSYGVFTIEATPIAATAGDTFLLL